MVRTLLLPALLALTLVPASAFPAPPETREQALAALADASELRRAEAVAWVAKHGSQADTELLAKRLHDASPVVRGFAEQGLWLLWSRSGDAAIDRLMARGIEEMEAGRHGAAAATFSEVIRQRPDFAEGWNKRATVRYLAGDYEGSMADCDEVLKRIPAHFGALSGYGQIQFQLERYDQAIRWWRRSLEVNPNMPGVELNLRRTEELLRELRGRTT